MSWHAWKLIVRIALLCVAGGAAGEAEGGDGRWTGRGTRPVRRYVATQSQSGLDPSAPFGTFYDEPHMTVGGNGFAGGAGFTPLSNYGGGTMVLYGPFSALRATAAPVTVVTRGYDGSFLPETGTAFSYPFLPPASPVVYPTRSQVRGSFPFQSTPPWWDTGHGWVDQR